MQAKALTYPLMDVWVMNHPRNILTTVCQSCVNTHSDFRSASSRNRMVSWSGSSWTNFDATSGSTRVKSHWYHCNNMEPELPLLDISAQLIANCLSRQTGVTLKNPLNHINTAPLLGYSYTAVFSKCTVILQYLAKRPPFGIFSIFFRG